MPWLANIKPMLNNTAVLPGSLHVLMQVMIFISKSHIHQGLNVGRLARLSEILWCLLIHTVLKSLEFFNNAQVFKELPNLLQSNCFRKFHTF